MKDLSSFKITSDWQEMDNFHSLPHSGIDLNCRLGTEIFSQDSGNIKLTEDQLLGNTIRLKLKNGETVIYGHLSRFNVKDGDYVNVGQSLGYTGGVPGQQGAGRSSAEHLHVSLKNSEGVLISPYNYLFKHNVYYGNSSPFLFPVMLILLLFVLWKLRKVFWYGFVVTVGITILFIVS